MTVAIVDLGYGNLGAVAQAFRRQGAEIAVTADRQAIARASRIVLPGVGAAGYAMARIDALGLRDVLSQPTSHMLGICLGMQLLFEASEEDGVGCLGLLSGRARRLEPSSGATVPHMGWSRLDVPQGGCGLATGDYAFFAHSYACDDGAASIATAHHGRAFAAAVRQGPLLGAQFHPERSAAVGARFIAAFLSC